MIANVTPDEPAEVDRLINGGHDELSLLFARHRNSLKKMVSLRISAPLQARVDDSDVIQDGYLEAARLLPDYIENPDLPPSIWIRRIVKQSLSRHIRFHVDTAKRSTRRENENYLEAGADTSSMVFALADSISSPASQVVKEEAISEIWRLLESVDPCEREVLCLKQIEGLTFEEVAAELDMGISSVKRRFQRAVIRLSKLAAHLA